MPLFPSPFRRPRLVLSTVLAIRGEGNDAEIILACTVEKGREGEGSFSRSEGARGSSKRGEETADGLFAGHQAAGRLIARCVCVIRENFVTG